MVQGEDRYCSYERSMSDHIPTLLKLHGQGARAGIGCKRFPNIQRLSSLTLIQHNQKIKIENEESTKYSIRIVDLYEVLFELLEGKQNKIKTIAISQLESLTNLADLYDLKSFIQSGIKEHFLQYPKPLYEAIAKDAPSYLRFATDCQWKFMFRQALVHCAGSFPGRAWPTPINTLSPTLQSIIIGKALHLADWSRRTEVQLFILTFADATNGRPVSPQLGKGHRELINLFREWLVSQLRINAQHSEAYERGIHYWKMYKRGDAYLPLAVVLEHFKNQFGGRHTFDVQKYLSELKNEVQGAVRMIAANQLDFMGREEYGIDYLTCLEVGDDDYPWV